MDRSISVVMLAGTIRPSALREKLDIPLLCLPMGRKGTLLDTWRHALSDLGPDPSVTVVLNTARDVDAVEHAAGDRWPGLTSIAEPAAWRGVGGLLRDVTGSLPSDALVVAIEANGLPPEGLGVLRDAIEPALDGFVGVCGADQPAGLYAFRRSAIERIPQVGYYDMKEQFLPALRDVGIRVRAIDLGDTPRIRIRDRDTYIEAVQATLGAGEDAVRIMPGASVSGSAIIEGTCIVASGAVIEDGAVVHDSVVLAGATIGGGAVISRSVVGPLVEVAPRAQFIRKVVVGDRHDGVGRRRRTGRARGEAATR